LPIKPMSGIAPGSTYKGESGAEAEAEVEEEEATAEEEEAEEEAEEEEAAAAEEEEDGEEEEAAGGAFCGVPSLLRLLREAPLLLAFRLEFAPPLALPLPLMPLLLLPPSSKCIRFAAQKSCTTRQPRQNKGHEVTYLKRAYYY
jgi:hypothetical protein